MPAALILQPAKIATPLVAFSGLVVQESVPLPVPGVTAKVMVAPLPVPVFRMFRLRQDGYPRLSAQVGVDVRSGRLHGEAELHRGRPA